MHQITFEFKMVPCQKPPFPSARPLEDLTRNLDAAGALARAIDPFFRFRGEGPRFSGLARRADENDGKPVFYVQLWDEGEASQVVCFRDLGYCGIMHLEALHGDIWEVVDQDLIGEIFLGFTQRRALPLGSDERWPCYVDGDNLEVTIGWKP